MSQPLTASTAAPQSLRLRVQRFGTFLSNMIMPNIAAIIAWGIVTAFFIPDGWTPNAKIATIVGPAIIYLLPMLIAYTGGKIVYDVRGGVVGAFAVMGVIMATSDPMFVGDQGGSPMFIGAMIVGPLAAWVMKRLDQLWEGKIKPGFEMLVNNFSAGIAATGLAIAGMFLLAPLLRQLITWLGNGVETLVDNNLLPLTSIFIEPAKVLFLNNAINHGVLTPLGISEAVEQGKSVLFLLEANPGPGLGILVAFMVFGRGMARASAPGAAIIHFFGGIHEIYFPYILAKPKLILAAVAGGATGVAINAALDVGLKAAAAPGSILAIYAQTARGDHFGVTLAVAASAAVSFAVAGFLLKTDSADELDLAAATASMESLKGKRSLASSTLVAPAGRAITRVVFACDAGMGSSAMGASVLRRKVQSAGHHDVNVTNKAIANLTDDVDLVVSHRDLTDRARVNAPSAIHVSVDDFMASPRYDEIVAMLGDAADDGGSGETPSATTAAAPEPAGDAAVLAASSIVLTGGAVGRDDAIDEAGALLVAAGAVPAEYVAAMHEREGSVSTHMGNGLAIPHGTNEAKTLIARTAVSFVRYPDGIDWNGHRVEFVVGIAAAGDDHLSLLQRLAGVFTDDAQADRLRAATTAAEVEAVLGLR